MGLGRSEGLDITDNVHNRFCTEQTVLSFENGNFYMVLVVASEGILAWPLTPHTIICDIAGSASQHGKLRNCHWSSSVIRAVFRFRSVPWCRRFCRGFKLSQRTQTWQVADASQVKTRHVFQCC